jgi:predicted dehydrogenase
MSPQDVRIGVIGGGLMGRELASAVGRWLALEDHPSRPRVTAVCDTNPAVLDWWRGHVATVSRLTGDYRELLEAPDVDVLYIAVPHDLHEQVYLDAAAAGKDFLGEKPFGIDLGAAERIVAAIDGSNCFVRCSSEFPFFPGAQLALETIRSGELGTILDAANSFLHSSDLDLDKAINWKRQVRHCGELGVLGDLGVHALHLPMVLGWTPQSVYAVLQNVVPERGDGRGGRVACDTWDNATLLCRSGEPESPFPLTIETKRIEPGAMNTWRLRASGLHGGVAFSTAEPKTVWRFTLDRGRQVWQRIETGSQSVFRTVTGGIFEFGFADAVQQMWAAYLAERCGELEGRFGCVTPAQALLAHRILDAALRSHASGAAELLETTAPLLVGSG